MLRAAQELGADFLVLFNRLFDAGRGVAYGGWDLSERNLRLSTPTAPALEATPTWCGAPRLPPGAGISATGNTKRACHGGIRAPRRRLGPAPHLLAAPALRVPGDGRQPQRAGDARPRSSTPTPASSPGCSRWGAAWIQRRRRSARHAGRPAADATPRGSQDARASRAAYRVSTRFVGGSRQRGWSWPPTGTPQPAKSGPGPGGALRPGVAPPHRRRGP